MRASLIAVLAPVFLLLGCQNEELVAHNRALLVRTEALEADNQELEIRAASCEQRLSQVQIGLSRPIFGDGESQEPVVAIDVAIAADGAFFLDGEPVELETIAARAAELGDRGRAVIAADGRARHEQVVAVIDALRQNGVERYALSVRAMEEP